MCPHQREPHRTFGTDKTVTYSRVSIQDIAHAVGLSVTAVSKALRGESGVGKDTRDRIRDVADRLGYVNPPPGLPLSIPRTYKAQFILPYDPVTHPGVIHQEVLDGAASVLSEHGYTIDLVYRSSLTRRRQTIEEALQSEAVDGSLLLAMRGSDIQDVPRRLERPVVVVNIEPEWEADCVVIDDRGGAVTATSHLINSGHRIIGHVAGPPDVSSNALRRLGYDDAMRTRDMLPEPDLVEIAEPTVPGGYRATSALLHRRPDITAIFCGRDMMAVGAIRALNEAGLRVPQDVSIVGFDDDIFAALHMPALTTVRKPRRLMGEKAGQVLLNRFGRSGRSRPRKTVIRTQLVKRDTVATIRTR